jgi:hypothetical protein
MRRKNLVLHLLHELTANELPGVSKLLCMLNRVVGCVVHVLCSAIF